MEKSAYTTTLSRGDDFWQAQQWTDQFAWHDKYHELRETWRVPDKTLQMIINPILQLWITQLSARDGAAITYNVFLGFQGFPNWNQSQVDSYQAAD